MANYHWPIEIIQKEVALHDKAKFKVCTACLLAQASINPPKSATNCDADFGAYNPKACWHCYTHGNKDDCCLAPLDLVYKFHHVQHLRDTKHNDYMDALNKLRYDLHVSVCKNDKTALAAARDEIAFLRAKLQQHLGEKGMGMNYDTIQQHVNSCKTPGCLTCEHQGSKEPWGLDDEWVEVKKTSTKANLGSNKK